MLTVTKYKELFEASLGSFLQDREITPDFIGQWRQFYRFLAQFTAVWELPVSQPYHEKRIDTYIFRVKLVDPDDETNRITLFDITTAMTSSLKILAKDGIIAGYGPNLSPLWRCVLSFWAPGVTWKDAKATLLKSQTGQIYRRIARPQIAVTFLHPCTPHDRCRDTKNYGQQLLFNPNWIRIRLDPSSAPDVKPRSNKPPASAFPADANDPMEIDTPLSYTTMSTITIPATILVWAKQQLSTITDRAALKYRYPSRTAMISSLASTLFTGQPHDLEACNLLAQEWCVSPYSVAFAALEEMWEWVNKCGYPVALPCPTALLTTASNVTLAGHNIVVK